MKDSVKAYIAIQMQSDIRLWLNPKPLKRETKEYLNITIYKFLPVYYKILQVIARENEK